MERQSSAFDTRVCVAASAVTFYLDQSQKNMNAVALNQWFKKVKLTWPKFHFWSDELVPSPRHLKMTFSPLQWHRTLYPTLPEQPNANWKNVSTTILYSGWTSSIKGLSNAVLRLCKNIKFWIFLFSILISTMS